MKTILVAEDNDSNYMLMTFILKKNYIVERSRNGQEAVEAADRGGIDLILMDIKMPVMDGLEATRRIKAAHPELPIIALTANAFDSDRQQAFEAGVDEFLSKPISSELCHATIARFI